MKPRTMTRWQARHFGQMLATEMFLLRVTHEVLARACAEEGVTVPYVKALLSGEVTYVSAKTIAICDALGHPYPDSSEAPIDHDRPE